MIEISFLDFLNEYELVTRGKGRTIRKEEVLKLARIWADRCIEKVRIYRQEFRKHEDSCVCGSCEDGGADIIYINQAQAWRQLMKFFHVRGLILKEEKKEYRDYYLNALFEARQDESARH